MSKTEKNDPTILEQISLHIKDAVQQEMTKKWEEFSAKNPPLKNMSENCNELFEALAKAQSSIDAAKKDKKNPFFKSNYADLPSVWNACKDPLASNGLCVAQTFSYEDGLMRLITTLGHSSGQWIRSEMPIISAKGDPQSIGSAITYFRRYSLGAIAGVTAEEDDDGNRAQGNGSRAVEKIDTKQTKEIQHLLKDKKELMNILISHLHRTQNVTQISDIPASLYPKVMNWLQDKLQEFEKEAESVA